MPSAAMTDADRGRSARTDGVRGAIFRLPSGSLASCSRRLGRVRAQQKFRVVRHNSPSMRGWSLPLIGRRFGNRCCSPIAGAPFGAAPDQWVAAPFYPPATGDSYRRDTMRSSPPG